MSKNIQFLDYTCFAELALKPDVLDGLAEQTGLSREVLLKRLSAVLPEMVDKMTPNGRL